jgi:hypothetical protein
MLLIMAAYVFVPVAFSWMIDPAGAWYRPYIIWMGIVLMAFFAQIYTPSGEDEW